MKKTGYFVIIAFLLLGCADTIENADNTPIDSNSPVAISFSLKGASDAITSVTGELQSLEHDDISFNFNISGETASFNIEHVQAGDWTLVVKAYSASAELRHEGSEQISITAGQVNSVSLVLDQTTGAMGFYVSFGTSGSVNININLATNPGSVDTYTYSLDRAGFNSVTGSNAVAGLNIITEIHDLKDGIWNLTILAKNGAAVVASGQSEIELMNGLVTKVDAAYNVIGPTVDISSQFDTQSGYADRVYVGDEAFRNYLIVKHSFTDLQSPYILRSDAESVTEIEISVLEFSIFGINKGVNDHLNAQALSAFTNVEEMIIFGFTLKSIELLNHAAIRTFATINVIADYIDLTGATNMKQFVIQESAIGWIDISNSTALEDVQIDGNEKQKGIAGFYFYPGHQIGTIYVSGPMLSDPRLTNTGYNKFIINHDEMVTVAIPDADAKRALLSHGLKILKGDLVDGDELDQVTDFEYYNPLQQQPRKGFGGFIHYKPMESDAVLALLPNLQYLVLNDQNFTSLDLSNNTGILHLEVSQCHFLNSIDISMLEIGNYPVKAKLGYKKGSPPDLVIDNNTTLTNLNFGTQQYVYAIRISGQPFLTSLNVSGFTNTYEMYLDGNALTSVVIGVNSSVNYLYLYDNQFTSLILSDLNNLTTLDVSNNQLTTLVLDSLANLSYLYANDNQLDTIDVSNFDNTILNTLNIQNNLFTSLDLSPYANVSNLDVSNNDIQPDLDLTAIGSFNYVYANGNPNLGTIYFDTCYQNGNNVYYDDPPTSLIDVAACKQ